MGRVPLDQKFRFKFPKFSYVEWNGIFHQAGPISSIPAWAHISRQNAKDHGKVAVLSAISCFMERNLTVFTISLSKFFLDIYLTDSNTISCDESNLRTFLAGEYANRTNWLTGNSEVPVKVSARHLFYFAGHYLKYWHALHMVPLS